MLFFLGMSTGVSASIMFIVCLAYIVVFALLLFLAYKRVNSIRYEIDDKKLMYYCKNKLKSQYDLSQIEVIEHTTVRTLFYVIKLSKTVSLLINNLNGKRIGCVFQSSMGEEKFNEFVCDINAEIEKYRQEDRMF